MARTDTLGHYLTDVADAIRAKAGTSDTIQASQFDTAIANIPSGGGGVPENGVFFMDYDGSIVEAWESSSVASKTSLPNNPSHTGLTSQGWNWTLQKIKDYVENHQETNLYVGQLYATSSGLTEFDIILTKVTGLTVTCNMVGNKNWGDGTTDSLTTHTYENYGNYTITCDGTSINGNVFGYSGNVLYLCVEVRISNSVTSIMDSAFYSCYSLQSITIPSSVTSIKDYTFQNCYSLQSITIPSSVTSIKDSTFQNCYSLQRVAIPDSVTDIHNLIFLKCYALQNITIPSGATIIRTSAFQNCYSLQSIIIPDSVTIISTYAFQNCYVLQSITMPSSVTSIENYVFQNCYSIIKYDFSNSSSIPTLSSTNAFSSINKICKIIVPDTLYNDWIVATNWSTYADYIYKASEVEE